MAQREHHKARDTMEGNSPWLKSWLKAMSTYKGKGTGKGSDYPWETDSRSWSQQGKLRRQQPVMGQLQDHDQER